MLEVFSDYILLPAPNRLITIVKLDIQYPSLKDLEAVRKLVDDSEWGIKEVRQNFPNYEIEEYAVWTGDKEYSFIVYNADDASGWKEVFEEAGDSLDPNFMIFTANYYKIKRICNILMPFI